MESAREAFFYLLAFLTLGCWSVAVGAIWFARIDQWFDDPLAYSYHRDLTFPIASILVAFPVYLLAMRSVLREQALYPDKRESGVRRWLTNLALLITALILIGDLTYFLARFLGGGLSMSFVLRSLVVSIIAGGIFWYYTAAVARRKERAA
jgi:heme A synthase